MRELRKPITRHAKIIANAHANMLHDEQTMMDKREGFSKAAYSFVCFVFYMGQLEVSISSSHTTADPLEVCLEMFNWFSGD